MTGIIAMDQKFELSGRGLLARAISTATVMSLAAGAAPSRAAEGVIEEVVVTVQRRAEALSDTPLAVTSLSGDFIRQVNLDDVKDLVSFTPGVTGDSKDSFIDALNIRGVITNDFGVGGDPSISIFKNDLYQGRNGAVVTSLYDIDRAEVLRGPQSFLFGRNSIGGAISVHTRRPDFDGVNGYAEVDVGQREHRVLDGAVNVPFSDTFAGRLALYSSHEDGYVDNVQTPSGDDLIKEDKQAGRLSLRMKTDATDVNFMAEYEDRDQSGQHVPGHPEGRQLADAAGHLRRDPRRQRPRRGQRLRARRAGQRPDPEPGARDRARPRLRHPHLHHRLQGSPLPLRRGLRRHAAGHQRLRPGPGRRLPRAGAAAGVERRRRLLLVRGGVLLPGEHRRAVHPARQRRRHVPVLLPRVLRHRLHLQRLLLRELQLRPEWAGREQRGEGQVPGLGRLRGPELRLHGHGSTRASACATPTTRRTSSCRRSR